MITARSTRLFRTPDLRAFRRALIGLSLDGGPLEARDRLVVVPTRAAGEHLRRSIERHALGPETKPGLVSGTDAVETKPGFVSGTDAVETKPGLVSGRAVILPEFVTPRDLVARFAERVADAGTSVLTDAEREVLLGVACGVARDAGVVPPFRLRPGLTAEVLRFYDELRLHGRDTDAFERLAVGELEPAAEFDRGAARLLRQTRFLVAAFREFEARAAATGALDVHGLRARVLAAVSARPWRHVVVAVADAARDRHGLAVAHWDLLARVPGLERLDVVVTEGVLAGAFHERIQTLLPGIEEQGPGARGQGPGQEAGAGDQGSDVRVSSDKVEERATSRSLAPDPRSLLGAGPVVVVPATGEIAHAPRDREEEVALFARRVRRLARQGALTALDRTALVVQQPLPYVYVTREAFRAAAIPTQTLDAVPLAAEPYAAALDLVLSAVAADFARAPSVALLRSPHFRFSKGAGSRRQSRETKPGLVSGSDPSETKPGFVSVKGEGGDAVGGFDCAALDRALSEAHFLGGREALDAVVARWRNDEGGGAGRLALPTGEALVDAAAALAPLAADAPRAAHLECLLAFLAAHERLPGPDDPARTRQLRARAAVLGTLESLRSAAARFDPRPVPFDEVVALVRRWLEDQTFALRTGEGGVHVVDADSARFGDFDVVHLAGLVDAEWPPRPRRSIFYSPALLRQLGWPSETDLLQGARDAFLDLLRLPARELLLSRFTLEDDTLVAPSPLLEDAARIGLEAVEIDDDAVRVFDHEALALAPIRLDALDGDARAWAGWRVAQPSADDPRFRGFTGPPIERAFPVSMLERYLDCPFQYFARRELRLDEAPDDEPGLSPKDRGTFLHAVFQAFFEAWDASGHDAIAPGTIDRARDLFRQVAEPRLDALPPADAALERARLFGSAIRTGIVDVVLGLETARPGEVRERWLEHQFDGEFTLGDRRVALRGVADRVDLLAGRRLRVIDYKTGSAPKSGRALQVPLYALMAAEELERRDGAAWEVEEGAYLAFGARRPFTPVVKPGKAGATALAKARDRAREVVDGIARGEFPPRPHDPIICTWCAYPSVCRKDYVGDE